MKSSSISYFGAGSLAASLFLSGCTGVVTAEQKASGSNPAPANSPTAGGSSVSTIPGGAGASGQASPSCNGTRDVPDAPMRRLTREEYLNSVRDLLSITPASVDIPSDESIGPFASNTVTAVTDLSTQQYADSARTFAKAAVAGVDKLVACNRPATSDAACASQFIDRFATRAFRRALTSDEKARYVSLYTTYAASGGFADGIRMVLATVLQSPNFLYHIEFNTAPAAGQAVVPLTSFEVAARLSSFLWKSVPDDTLITAATSGGLGDASAVRVQAERMLKDSRAADAITSFHSQWLDLAELPAAARDAKLYPKFNASVAAAMQAETAAFANYVLTKGDGRLETLLSAPFSLLDGPLYDLYGVAKPAGQSGPTLVQLDPKQRAGLLTQAAFLTAHAHQNQTSPVGRGVTVRRNVMCEALPDPPPDVNTEPPEVQPGATTRERLAVHESEPSCGGCHTLIDRIGLGFEAYDAVGAYRSTDQGKPVDTSGEVTGSKDIDGPFSDAVALSKKLAGSKEVQQCVARQWFRFALGRMETENDACSLKNVYDSFDASNHDVRQLLTALVASDAFRFRRVVTQ